VTHVLLQLDHVSGTTYLPVCETRSQLHRIQKTTENIDVSDGLHAAHRDFFDYCLINTLTYLLSHSRSLIRNDTIEQGVCFIAAISISL